MRVGSRRRFPSKTPSYRCAIQTHSSPPIIHRIIRITRFPSQLSLNAHNEHPSRIILNHLMRPHPMRIKRPFRAVLAPCYFCPSTRSFSLWNSNFINVLNENQIRSDRRLARRLFDSSSIRLLGRLFVVPNPRNLTIRELFQRDAPDRRKQSFVVSLH